MEVGAGVHGESDRGLPRRGIPKNGANCPVLVTPHILTDFISCVYTYISVYISLTVSIRIKCKKCKIFMEEFFLSVVDLVVKL